MSNPVKIGNSSDPLLRDGGGRKLYIELAQACSGFSREEVITSASNLLINVLRQEHSTGGEAEAAFCELANRIRSILGQHYNGRGSRKGVYPFDQHIVVPELDVR